MTLKSVNLQQYKNSLGRVLPKNIKSFDIMGIDNKFKSLCPFTGKFNGLKEYDGKVINQDELNIFVYQIPDEYNYGVSTVNIAVHESVAKEIREVNAQQAILTKETKDRLNHLATHGYLPLECVSYASGGSNHKHCATCFNYVSHANGAAFATVPHGLYDTILGRQIVCSHCASYYWEQAFKQRAGELPRFSRITYDKCHWCRDEYPILHTEQVDREDIEGNFICSKCAIKDVHLLGASRYTPVPCSNDCGHTIVKDLLNTTSYDSKGLICADCDLKNSLSFKKIFAHGGIGFELHLSPAHYPNDDGKFNSVLYVQLGKGELEEIRRRAKTELVDLSVEEFLYAKDWLYSQSNQTSLL